MRNFSIQNIQRICLTLGATLLVVLGTTQASAQVIFSDDFNGTGNVDTTKWRLPFDTEGTFVGRTQYRGDTAVDMPQKVGGNAELHLDTYSPIDPGNAFIGHDLLTKRNFAVGGGLTIESRLRLAPSAAQSSVGGQVGGFFLFDVTRDTPAGSNNIVRDEIDFELLGNEVVSGNNRVGTNNWNDGNFASSGDLQLHTVGGVDLTQFNDYKMEWTPDVIKWYVNNNLVRVQTEDVPDDPMKLHFNVWAPDSSFSDAFDAALQPTAVEANNTRYTLQVDDVSVTRRNTTIGANLLTNGDFEGDDPTDINAVPKTTTDTWLSFGNVFIESEVENSIPVNPSSTGSLFALKMFGPFNGGPDASGVLQNVVASPGQVFEGSVDAITPLLDSIAGSENFNTFSVSFLDANGDVIQEAFADPGNIVDTNAKDFPLLDGRDTNMIEDQWVSGTVNAVAPAGTAYARISLFFIQLNNEGGASWFDNASLTLLDATTAPTLAGDFNNDGTVDAADYTVWRDNLGNGSEASLNGNGDGLDGVDAGDYALWAANFGNTASSSATAAAVPEPSAGVLLLAGLLLCKRRK